MLSPVREATNAPARVLTSCSQLLSLRHADPQLLFAALSTLFQAEPDVGKALSSDWFIQIPADGPIIGLGVGVGVGVGVAVACVVNDLFDEVAKFPALSLDLTL